MCQYCAARRLVLSTLRSRAPVSARQVQRRMIATQPPNLQPEKMSKGTFLASVGLIGGLSGVGAAYVTTPVE